MAIKDLFKEKNLKYLTPSSLSDLTQSVESVEYIDTFLQDKKRYIPLVDYSKEKNFARFGSAEKYYYDSIKRTYQTYPYDGSLKEKIQWELSSSYLDLYLLDNGYPRTTGFAVFSTSSLAFTDYSVGYGAAGTSSYEYISIKGGPHAGTAAEQVYIDRDTGEATYREGANIYDLSENRECNLKIGGIDGNTVEFWMKKAGFATSATGREVIFDNHTANAASSSADYGRLTLEMTGTTSGSPFLLTYMSGTSGFSDQVIGSSITTSSVADDSWHHYAVTLKNSGNNVKINFYVDGTCNHTVTAGSSIDYVSGTLNANIGALATHPSGTTSGAPEATLGWGKLSGSLDEFRFWKVERTPQQIQERWFDQVGGGTNTDKANTDLGVYFKFNEGITGDTSIDDNVLDYSGRLSNGTWTGYNSAASRDTGSAINQYASASAIGKYNEFQDPIIYSTHPDVLSYMDTLRKQGREYDYTNISNIYYSLPSWILEEQDTTREADGIADNSLWNLTQIMSSYFDDLAMQIKTLPELPANTYPSGTIKPPPFMDRIVQSQGFVTPELFSTLGALEQLESQNAERQFTEKLADIKNSILKNIQNNLLYIYKSKGTEKSFRNLMRCFGIDDEIYKFNLYGNNIDFVLRDNYRSVVERYKMINFNKNENQEASVYQYSSSANPNTTTFISASGDYDTTKEGAGLAFSVEAAINFPLRVSEQKFRTRKEFDTIMRNNYPVMITSSLFGMHTADDSDAADTTWASNDYANFYVEAVKESTFSQRAFFRLTGSADGFIPELTSSYFDEVYKDKHWNFLVSVYPTAYPFANQVSGTENSDQTYTVQFSGINNILDVTDFEFTVTGTMTRDEAYKFMASPKRTFIGAHRTNFSGGLITPTDVKFNNFRVWQNKLTLDNLKLHGANPKNYGIENPAENAYLFQTSINNVFVPKQETLLLHWNFDNVTGSDTNGGFIVDDLTSGSITQTARYGWLGDLKKQQYTGTGSFFAASSTDVYKMDEVVTAKPNLPEILGSSDTINVLSNDDVYFTRDKRPIFFDMYVEKSPYQNISEEMINFISSVTDFNNLIGQTVDRYRDEYKDLATLRSLFFERIGNVPDIDRYIDYFKWFDSAVTVMIKELAPLSSGLSERPLRNIIESHILERNKYVNKFPSYEFKQSDPVAHLLGVNELLYDWKEGHAPLDSAQQATNCLWWKDRASRSGLLTSGDSSVDSNKQEILEVLNNENSASAPILSGTNGSYEGSTYAIRKLATPYRFTAKQNEQVIGGANFYQNKKIGFFDSINQFKAGSEYGIIQINSGDLEDFKDCDDNLSLNNGKRRYSFKAKSKIGGGSFSADDEYKGQRIFPFSLYSASISDGVNAEINSNFANNVDITNLHIDSTNLNAEVPAQGPFTEKFVGGRTYRHNMISFSPNLDLSLINNANREEGWRLTVASNVIKLLNADYGDSGAARAQYFRNVGTKRPVNIGNILQFTGSSPSGFPVPLRAGQILNATNIGNYSKKYEIVMTNGRSINNSYFVKNEEVTASSADMNVVTDMSTSILPVRGKRDHVIVNRFSNPGTPSTMGEGYLDLEAAEYSPYNASPYRNIIVRDSLNEWYTDHANQFGYFSDAQYSASWVAAQDAGNSPGTYPGSKSTVNANNYVGSASFHKVNRNPRHRPQYSNAFIGDSGTLESGTLFDNWFVQHQIPQSDYQYQWITSSVLSDANGIVNNPFLGFEQPNFSNAGYASSDITFVGTSSIENSNGVRVDFAGMNNIVVDTVETATNTLVGGPTNFENIVFGTVDSTQVLNALNLHRCGPYQWASWQQTRGDRNRIIRTYNAENRFSYLEEEAIFFERGGSATRINITSAIEPPVTGKFRPLNHTVIVKDDQASNATHQLQIKHSYMNALTHFTDHSPEGFNLDDKILTAENAFKGQLTYDAINYYLLGNDVAGVLNPFEGFDSLSIKETIFPREQYTYLAKTRQRENYANDFWRDSRSERNLINITNSSGEVLTTVSQSMWPLDAREDFATAAVKNFGSGSEGELQNNYTQFHSAGSGARTLDRLKLAAVYARRIQVSGAGDAPGTEIFAGDTMWEAGTQSGKNPFYNTYGEYADDLRRVGKDHGLIPEFRISEHMDFYINEKGGDFLAENTASFSLTGASIPDSSDEDFFAVYSNTDFLKTFKVVNSDYSKYADVSNITLSANGLIKFLPYNGFYPADRTTDLVDLFWNDYSNNIFPEGSDLPVTPTDIGQTFNLVKEYPRLARPIWQVMFAPGILYNSIKSAIAVDYPYYTGSHVVSGTAAEYYNFSGRGIKLHDVPRISGFHADAPETSAGVHYFERAPFETLLDPEQYLQGASIVDLEPHPSASQDVTASLAGGARQTYRLAMHNFLASTIDFFKPDGQLVKIESLPDNDPNFGIMEEGKRYAFVLNMFSGKIANYADMLNIMSQQSFAPFIYSASYITTDPSCFTYRAYDTKLEFSSSVLNGAAFGPPFQGSVETFSGFAYNNYYSASYEPYTPAYYNGFAVQYFYFDPPRTDKFSLSEILSDLQHGFHSSLGTSPRTHVDDGSQTMPISSSVNVKQAALVPQFIPNALGEPQAVPSDPPVQKWVVQPKWETPVINFKDVFDNGDLTLPAVGASGSNVGIWHQKGRLPSSDQRGSGAKQEGIFLQVDEIPESVKTNPSLTGSLADVCGFSKRPVKIGEVAPEKTISEAIIAIPFRNVNGVQKRYNIDREIIDLAENFIKTGKLPEQVMGVAPQKKPSEEIIEMVRKIKKFVIPPRLDYITYKDQNPFAMFIFDFSVTLTQEDLADIWQNLPPTIGRQFQMKDASLPVDVFLPEATKGTAMMEFLDEDTQWMVFKAKQKSAWNYFEKTADSRDDTGYRFQLKKSTGASGQKEGVPEYNYNWPYDFFSLVELAKIDADITVTEKPGIDLPTDKEPMPIEYNQGVISALVDAIEEKQLSPEKEETTRRRTETPTLTPDEVRLLQNVPVTPEITPEILQTVPGVTPEIVRAVAERIPVNTNITPEILQTVPGVTPDIVRIAVDISRRATPTPESNISRAPRQQNRPTVATPTTQIPAIDRSVRLTPPTNNSSVQVMPPTNNPAVRTTRPTNPADGAKTSKATSFVDADGNVVRSKNNSSRNNRRKR